MNKNKKINKKSIFNFIIFVVILIMFILLNYFGFIKNRKNQEAKNENIQIEEEYNDMKNNSTMYDNSSSIEELKEEYKISGDNNLYDVSTESDGRKIINVKTSINYKVAFAGMIKESKPNFNKIDSLFEKNNPSENGIWIVARDRNKILSYLNNNEYLNCKYTIDNNGYLKLSNTDNATDIDKKIEKIINGDNQIILSISSIYYMVDTVTGEIVDNPYNLLSRYQPYEYVQDEDKMIIFITENKENYMTENDIFSSLMNLSESIE